MAANGHFTHDSEYFNFNFRIQNEEEALAVLREQLDNDDNLVGERMLEILNDFHQDPVYWEELRNKASFDRFLNWERAPLHAACGFAERRANIQPPRPPPPRPTVVQHSYEVAESAAHFRDLVERREFCGNGPLIVTPMWDHPAQGEPQLRGACISNVETRHGIVIDMAILGEDTLNLSETLEHVRSLFVFWSESEMKRIMWTLALRFMYVLVLKETFLALGPRLTQFSFSALLSSREQAYNRLREAETFCENQNAPFAFMVGEAELVSDVFKRASEYFPNTINAGLALSEGINERESRINDPTFLGLFGDAFNDPNHLFNDVQNGRNFRERLHNIVDIIDTAEPEWMANFFQGLRRSETPGQLWYRRGMLQQNWKTLNFSDAMTPSQYDLEVAAAISTNLGLAVNMRVVATNDQLQQIITECDLPAAGALCIAAIDSTESTFDSPRGFAAFVPSRNLLLVMDMNASGLEVFHMCAEFDKLPNPKILWDLSSAVKLKRFFDFNIQKAIIMQHCLGEDVRGVHWSTAAVVLSSSAFMREYSANIRTQLDVERSIGRAALCSVGIAAIAAKVFTYGTDFVQYGLQEARQALQDPMHGQPWHFPTMQETVAHFRQKGFLTSTFDDAAMQTLDPNMLYLAFEWRLLIAIEQGKRPDLVLSDAAVWDAGFLTNIRNNISRSQWTIYQAKNIHEMSAQDWDDARKLWQNMCRNVGLRACNLCGFSNNHNRFCGVGNVVTSVKQATAGLQSYEKYYRALGIVADFRKFEVRQRVDKMYRIGERFQDCSTDRHDGRLDILPEEYDDWRAEQLYTEVHFFRFPGMRCTMRTTYESLLQVFATKWILPGSKFWRQTDYHPEVVRPPLGTTWQFGAKFSVCCLRHCNNMPNSVRLLDGIMVFKSHSDIIKARRALGRTRKAAERNEDQQHQAPAAPRRAAAEDQPPAAPQKPANEDPANELAEEVIAVAEEADEGNAEAIAAIIELLGAAGPVSNDQNQVTPPTSDEVDLIRFDAARVEAELNAEAAKSELRRPFRAARLLFRSAALEPPQQPPAAPTPQEAIAALPEPPPESKEVPEGTFEMGEERIQHSVATQPGAAIENIARGSDDEATAAAVVVNAETTNDHDTADPGQDHVHAPRKVQEDGMESNKVPEGTFKIGEEGIQHSVATQPGAAIENISTGSANEAAASSVVVTAETPNVDDTADPCQDHVNAASKVQEDDQGKRTQ